MKNSRTKMASILLACGFSVVSTSAKAGIVVSPLIIDFHPGDSIASEEFALSVTCDQGMGVTAEPVEIMQNLEGESEPHPIEKDNPLYKVVILDKPDQKIERAGILGFSGRVNFNRLPIRRNSNFLGLLVSEHLPPRLAQKSGPQSQILIRYLIKLNIDNQAGRTQSPAQGVFTFTGIEKRLGRLYVTGLFKSKSGDKMLLTSSVSIRDMKARKVEDIDVNTKAAMSAKLPSSPVFPGASVIFRAPISKINQPGWYNFAMKIKMSDRQLAATKKFEVTKEMLDNSKFTVGPMPIVLPLAQARLVTWGMEIENPQDKSVIVSLVGGGTLSGDGRYGWQPKTMTLGPKTAGRVQFTVLNNALDAPKIEGVGLIIKDGISGKILDQRRIPVSFLQPMAKVRDSASGDAPKK